MANAPQEEDARKGQQGEGGGGRGGGYNCMCKGQAGVESSLELRECRQEEEAAERG